MTVRITRLPRLRRGVGAQHVVGAQEQDVEVVGAVDERQQLDEHAGELAAVLGRLLAVADVARLAPQQLEHDAAGALRPQLGVGREHAADQLGDHGAGLLQQRAGQLGAPVDRVAQRLLEGARGERPHAADRGVDRGGQRVDVGAAVDDLAADLLRGR